jgi:hypothetical protein
MCDVCLKVTPATGRPWSTQATLANFLRELPTLGIVESRTPTQL